MDRLKQFGIWILAVIAFMIFSNIIISIYMHPEEIGGKIYNATHKTEIVNETKK